MAGALSICGCREPLPGRSAAESINRVPAPASMDSNAVNSLLAHS
jgi:hypothetical protein